MPPGHSLTFSLVSVVGHKAIVSEWISLTAVAEPVTESVAEDLLTDSADAPVSYEINALTDMAWSVIT